MDFKLLISLQHPANNPLYQKLYTEYVKGNTCLLCKAMSLADKKYTPKMGVHLIIPWCLCIQHIPKGSVLQESLLNFDRCRKIIQFEKKWTPLKKRNLGIPNNKMTRYLDYAEKKEYKEKEKDLLLKTIKKLHQGPLAKENERLLSKNYSDAIQELNNGLQKLQNIVGSQYAYEMYVNQEFSRLLSKQIDNRRKNDEITKLRKINRYFLLGMEMFKLARKWGNDINYFPEIKLPKWEEDFHYKSFNDQYIQQCNQDCIWINGTKYPCLDGFCLQYIRKSNNIFLVNGSSDNHYIVVRNYYKDVQDVLENLELCGIPLNMDYEKNNNGDHIFKSNGKDKYYKVKNLNIRPLRDYFKMGLYEPSCKLPLPQRVRLKWLLNIHFWKTVTPLIKYTLPEKIVLTVDNVWYDLEHFYVWGANRGDQFPFQKFANVLKEEEDLLLNDLGIKY